MSALDLYIGIAIQLSLMAVSFVAAWWLTRRAPTLVCDLLAAVTVIAIAVYARWFWEHTFMATLLPFSNLIVVSNWFPLAAGFLAGLVWQRIRDRPERIPGIGTFRGLPRRIFATAILGIAGVGTLVVPLRGQPPRCGNDWQGDLCLQTSGATCSAAAGATLLQYYGVYVSEGDMAELCLTRQGTNWKGLYRGLTLLVKPLAHNVEVFELTVDDLIEQFNEPCILQCELKIDDEEASVKYELDGWIRGQPHSIVLLEISEDEADRRVEFEIFDPSVGVETWQRDAIETLWHGQGLRVVPSGDADPLLAALK